MKLASSLLVLVAALVSVGAVPNIDAPAPALRARSPQTVSAPPPVPTGESSNATQPVPSGSAPAPTASPTNPAPTGFVGAAGRLAPGAGAAAVGVVLGAWVLV